MRNISPQIKTSLTLFLAATLLIFLGTPARAQSAPVQNGRDDKPLQDNDTTRRDLVQFDQFLDSHREIAEQLRKDPSLVANKDFVKNHPALQTFLQSQPQIREELTENPTAFMRQEDRFDQNGDARRDLVQFNQFLDSHREIAEQLRRDPALANNREFVQNHPKLQAFLQDQPGVRDELRENPNAFMQEEDHYNQIADARDRDDHDRNDHDRAADFGKFLGGHSDIARDMSKDPSKCRDQAYVENHPDLKEYLGSHPDIQQSMSANPDAFVKEAMRFGTDNNGAKTGGWSTGSTITTTAPDPTHDATKPKQ